MLAHISDDSYQSFVGIVLSILGSFCFVAGWQMIQGANQELIDKGLKIDKIDKKKWYGGVILNIIAGIFDSIALAFTAQSKLLK